MLSVGRWEDREKHKEGREIGSHIPALLTKHGSQFGTPPSCLSRACACVCVFLVYIYSLLRFIQNRDQIYTIHNLSFYNIVSIYSCH